MENVLIRNEKESDHKIVEYITREAFCNQSEVDFDDLIELQRIFRVL